jgi:hypothetical protein
LKSDKREAAARSRFGWNSGDFTIRPKGLRGWQAMMQDLTLAEAAARLGRNLELVRTWVASGRLPGHKRAHIWFVAERDVSKFVKREQPVRRTWSPEAKRRARRRAAAGRNEK